MIRGIVYDPPTFGFPILVVLTEGERVLSVETAPSLPMAELQLQDRLRALKRKLAAKPSPLLGKGMAGEA